MPSISILIEGKVQGVFYRKSARDKALELGLTGEVQNQENGSVFIIASGEKNSLTAFTEWCRQGPPRAIVTAVTVEEIADRSFNGFQIVR